MSQCLRLKYVVARDSLWLDKCLFGASQTPRAMSPFSLPFPQPPTRLEPNRMQSYMTLHGGAYRRFPFSHRSHPSKHPSGRSLSTSKKSRVRCSRRPRTSPRCPSRDRQPLRSLGNRPSLPGRTLRPSCSGQRDRTTLLATTSSGAELSTLTWLVRRTNLW